MKSSTKVSILAISIGVFSVGIAFAVISNSDEIKIRELISEYQIVLNTEEIENTDKTEDVENDDDAEE